MDNTVLVDYKDKTYVAEIEWDDFEEEYVLSSLIDEDGQEVEDAFLEELALDRALSVMEYRWRQEVGDD